MRARLVELWNRVIKNDDSKNKIYFNGEDNFYPYEIERATLNSPTAVRCLNIMSNFVAGLGTENDYVVNSKTNERISDVAKRIADDTTIHNGVWLHIGYGIDDENGGLNIVPKTIKVLNYLEGRKTKEDDEDNEGMYVFKNWAEKTYSFQQRKSEGKKYYPFNRDVEVVKSQIIKDYNSRNNKEYDGSIEALKLAIKSYRGQVFYLNLTPQYLYALPFTDSVFNAMDTEYRIWLYSNTQARTGFLGKTIFIANEGDEEQSVISDEQIAGLLGAENSASALKIDVKAEDLDNVLKVIQLKPQYDDKLFETTKKQAIDDIIGVFGIPKPLFDSSDSALFGANSETLRQLKLVLSEQTQWRRDKIDETLTFLGFPYKTIPIVEVDVVKVEEDI